MFFFVSLTRTHINTHLTFSTEPKKKKKTCTLTHTYPLYISTFMYIHRKRKVLFNVN